MEDALLGVESLSIALFRKLSPLGFEDLLTRRILGRMRKLFLEPKTNIEPAQRLKGKNPEQPFQVLGCLLLRRGRHSRLDPRLPKVK